MDTAPKQSIAFHMLYEILKKKIKRLRKRQYLLNSLMEMVQQAMFWSRKKMCFHGWRVKTKFIIFPESKDNLTLLGVDFLQDAKLAVNLAQHTYKFDDMPDTEFPLIYESPLSCTKQVELSSFENLRPKEGTMLSESQRNTLITFLQDNEDIFREEGRPDSLCDQYR